MNSTRTVVVALTCVLAVVVGIAIGLLVLVLLAATGHLLVFTTPPIQVCVGWPDDTVFSWWCTPDYTAQPPTAFIGDPAFWHMLTPEGRRVLAAVTVVATAEPCEILPGYPYAGGVYQGDTNTIMLCGQAAQDNLNILRHESLHALDAVDGPDTLVVSEKLYSQAEAMYNAGGGSWFRPGELYAMLPLVVDWDFAALPPLVAETYAPWFRAASTAP